MKKLLILSVALLLLSSAAFAEDINNNDQEVITYMKSLEKSLNDQKKTKNTYKGIISSKNGTNTVNLINSRVSEPITIATSDKGFCMMVKLSNNSNYCIDNTGFSGNGTGCNKNNISCSVKAPVVTTSTKKYDRNELISMIKELIKKKSLTLEEKSYGIKENYLEYKEQIKSIKTFEELKSFLKENGAGKELEKIDKMTASDMEKMGIGIEDIITMMVGPKIPDSLKSKEFVQGEYGMLVMETFKGDDGYYYTINPIFGLKDGKWKIVLDKTSTSDKSNPITINNDIDVYNLFLEAGVSTGNGELISRMAELGANINEPPSGDIYLIEAARWGRIDAIKALLKAGADVYKEDSMGDTALCEAVSMTFIDSDEDKKTYFETIEELIKFEKEDKKEANIKKAAVKAYENNNKDMFEVLMRHVSNPLAIYDSVLENSITMGNTDAVKQMMSIGADIKRISSAKDSFLRAAEYGYYKVVNSYLTAGIDPNIKNEDEKTALILAAEGDSLDDEDSTKEYISVIKALLEKGANINAQDNYGTTALMAATERNMKPLVEELISQKADLKIKNSGGETVLKVAKRYGHDEIKDLLIKAGATE
ncbi:MAG: ankyrin repeat domain-containing protein [Candidatus Pacebacteria bacterium]|nr:ankyrin repeat domain-containing protein [Candidatus Paceibacterota bacterium]